MKKKYLKIILILILIFIVMIMSSIIKHKNLIFMNETEEKELLELLQLREDTESFQPINYTKRKTELGSIERVKVIEFNISKRDYEKNELKYENNSELLDRGLIIDKGDYYKCELQISKYNKTYNYENINPKSQMNEIISRILQFFMSIYIIIAIIIIVCKDKILHKVLNIFLGIVVLLMILVFIYINSTTNFIWRIINISL